MNTTINPPRGSATAPAPGWETYYRRRDAIDAVLDRARDGAAGRLPFADVPGVRAVFDGPEDLLLAMHYRWIQLLTGYVNIALDELDSGTASTDDPIEAVGAAWRSAARERPVLRRVLDEHSPGTTNELRAAYSREMRLLAVAAELAGPAEPVGASTKIGATYRALLRATPEPRPRRGPFAALTRRARVRIASQ